MLILLMSIQVKKHKKIQLKQNSVNEANTQIVLDIFTVAFSTRQH